MAQIVNLPWQVDSLPHHPAGGSRCPSLFRARRPTPLLNRYRASCFLTQASHSLDGRP